MRLIVVRGFPVVVPSKETGTGVLDFPCISFLSPCTPQTPLCRD